MTGYPFICPDMIGGGQLLSFLPGSAFDPELFVRSAQVHALCPMMQISASPWRALDAEHQRAFVAAVKLRQKFAPRFVELARDAAKTGEPIIRSLEYVFPGQAYGTIRDQFLMGRDLMVAPQVQKGGRTRRVDIPPGKWRADDGCVVEGPQTVTVDTPLARVPYFEAVRGVKNAWVENGYKP